MVEHFSKFEIDTGAIYRNESSKGKNTDLSYPLIEELESKLIVLFDKYDMVSRHKPDELLYRVKKYERFHKNMEDDIGNPFSGYYVIRYSKSDMFQSFETELDENGHVIDPLLSTGIIDYDKPEDYCYDIYDFNRGIKISYHDEPDQYPYFFSFLLRQFKGEDRIDFIKYQGSLFFKGRWTDYKRFIRFCLIDYKHFLDKEVVRIIEEWINAQDKDEISQPVLALYYHYMMKEKQMKSFEAYNMKGLDAYEHVLKKNNHLMLGNRKRSIPKFYQLYKAIQNGGDESPIKPKYLKEVILLLEDNPEARKIAIGDLESF